MISIDMFHVGQEVCIGDVDRLTRIRIDKLPQKAVVERVGRKYVVANGIKFEEPQFKTAPENCLVEHTAYSIEKVLFRYGEDYQREKSKMLDREYIAEQIRRKLNDLPAEALKRIAEVLKEYE